MPFEVKILRSAKTVGDATIFHKNAKILISWMERKEAKVNNYQPLLQNFLAAKLMYLKIM